VRTDHGLEAITAKPKLFLACAVFDHWNTGISDSNPALDMINGCVHAVVFLCMHRPHEPRSYTESLFQN
jgi:hypothetical protein